VDACRAGGTLVLTELDRLASSLLFRAPLSPVLRCVCGRRTRFRSGRLALRPSPAPAPRSAYPSRWSDKLGRCTELRRCRSTEPLSPTGTICHRWHPAQSRLLSRQKQLLSRPNRSQRRWTCPPVSVPEPPSARRGRSATLGGASRHGITPTPRRAAERGGRCRCRRTRRRCRLHGRCQHEPSHSSKVPAMWNSLSQRVGR
jgi:hypothetical protein